MLAMKGTLAAALEHEVKVDVSPFEGRPTFASDDIDD
jgi:hypothetical protein